MLIGSLNPAIFTPDWLRFHEIIEVDEQKEAQIEIIHQAISKFTISEIRFSIERHRFIISSEAHEMSEIFNIVSKTFGEILPHTPLTAVGINYEEEFVLENADTRNTIGRQLAPLDPWGEWGQDLPNSDPKLNGGLASLTMAKVHSRTPFENISSFTVRPSSKADVAQEGVVLSSNNHFGNSKENADMGQKEINEKILYHTAINHSNYRKTFYDVCQTLDLAK